MDNLSQVALASFKHTKDRKSYIPTSVPVNYACSKRQKSGKSFIPRVATICSKQPDKENEKLSKKDKPSRALVNHCKPAKDKRSYIPRINPTKRIEPKPKKSLDKPISSLSGKSKIPVLALTKKPKNSVKPSTKKSDVKTRTSIHIRTCTSTHIRTCTSTHIRTSTLNANKKKNVQACVSVKKDERVHVSSFKAIKDIKIKNVDVAGDDVVDTQSRVLAFNHIQKDVTPSRISTLTSIKKSLIPVRRNSSYNFFKKRVAPLNPSGLVSVQTDTFAQTQTSTFILKEQNIFKEQNNFVYTTLKNKRIPLQHSFNNPEALISISRNKVELSTIIKPELSSISLLYKAEKDLSTVKHQVNGNDDDASLFGNVFKKIKDFFSKLI